MCQLSSHQSNPTQHELASAHRLLHYVSSHRNPHKTIHPSSMALWACTDASFPSQPKSGTVAGCSVGLGDPPPYFLNPPPESHRQRKPNNKTDPCPCFPPSTIQPILCPTYLSHPQRSPPCFLPAHTRGGCVCGRSEYSTAFGGGQVLVELTLTLTNLGHPQQTPLLIFVDNECAIGLATSSV